MTQFHIFGAATGTGESFRGQALSVLPDCSLYSYSRQPSKMGFDAYFVDFTKSEGFLSCGRPHCSLCLDKFRADLVACTFL